jgi:predicted N-acetyltransferase YhbS
MTASPIVVRPVATPDELRTQIELADQAFSSDPSASSVKHWRELITSGPEYRPEEIRGAFRAGEQVGGYIIYERMLRMGEARLTTGCISAVVTHPTFRHQGVARVLMLDAINYALAHKHALLLLDGIPKFYYRYGYIDVFDLSTQDIQRVAVLAQSHGVHSVRPATLDDAADVLALYERQYGPYTGSFTRSLEGQVHQLKYRSAQNPLLLAIDPDGQPQGYLALSRGEEHPQALEIAADNWSATIALLQHHARLLAGPDAPTSLRYRLSPATPMLQWMIDKLEVPDTSLWRHPADEWSVRSQSYHHRYAGWMARLAHLPTLVRQLVPEWQARWHRSLAQWSGDISLLIGNEAFTIQIDGPTLRLMEQPGTSQHTVKLTSQAFTQLIFGYRSANQGVAQEKQSLPGDVQAVLNILFPSGHAWIPSSDAF